jgi:hypothetical protein
MWLTLANFRQAAQDREGVVVFSFSIAVRRNARIGGR